MSDSPQSETVAPKAKKSKLVPILLVVVIILLTGGGAGAYFVIKHKSAAAKAPEPPPPPSGIVLLEPFTVNLADTEAPRFLRVTLRLTVDNAKEAKELSEDPVRMTKVRSAILELLTTQHSTRLTTPEGKTELKQQIAEHSSKVLAPIEVRDVLFSEFVVQF